MAARIEEPLPPAEEQRLIERFRRFQKTSAFVHEHYDRLLREHAEQWVAVAPDGVVASGSTWPELYAELRRRNIDASSLEVVYVTSKTHTLILSR